MTIAANDERLRELAIAIATDGSQPLEEEAALALAELPAAELPRLTAAARARRDRAWGRRVTFSPKVFLPLTNLCRNRCDYCSFRRSPGQDGVWTMRPDEVAGWLEQGRTTGCAEALFCLGDTPESAFPSYRRELASFGHDTTVEYLHRAGKMALEAGLLPHTNAGLLDGAAMARLKEVNVSLGLMLECVSPRLGSPGMPHHRAPDKQPAKRLAMLDEAGRLAIPFTTGILVGIGETRRERIESLLAIRALHRRHGHIQEVIVQGFRAVSGVPMASAPEPDDDEMTHAIAMARLILDDDVSLQAPPNLHPGATRLLLDAGINDLGGISPVTPDYINPRHAWPHLDALAAECASVGRTLEPRLPIYEPYRTRPGFLDAALDEAVNHAALRLRSWPSRRRVDPAALQQARVP